MKTMTLCIEKIGTKATMVSCKESLSLDQFEVAGCVAFLLGNIPEEARIAIARRALDQSNQMNITTGQDQ